MVYVVHMSDCGTMYNKSVLYVVHMSDWGTMYNKSVVYVIHVRLGYNVKQKCGICGTYVVCGICGTYVRHMSEFLHF